MTVAGLEYPVLCFLAKVVYVERSYHDLINSSTAGIKNGMYRGLFIVDSHGCAFKIKDARKVRGVGWFWGYNPCYGQRIEIELIIDEGPIRIDLNAVRQLVLTSFRT